MSDSLCELDHISMVLGWLMGKRVAGTRRPKQNAGYLVFSSEEPFTIATANTSKNWDGILYYSNDTYMWSKWDGTAVISSKPHGVKHCVYMRGLGNSIINGSLKNGRWVIDGSNVECVGNIETLLSFEIASIGEHPVMSENCYAYLFYECAVLIAAPELPATTLTNGCYYEMFHGCTSLTVIPRLSATALVHNCHGHMFDGCISIKLSETQTDEYPTAYRIPTKGDGTATEDSLIDMFVHTGGTFAGTPEINKTYYLHTSNVTI